MALDTRENAQEKEKRRKENDLLFLLLRDYRDVSREVLCLLLVSDKSYLNMKIYCVRKDESLYSSYCRITIFISFDDPLNYLRLSDVTSTNDPESEFKKYQEIKTVYIFRVERKKGEKNIVLSPATALPDNDYDFPRERFDRPFKSCLGCNIQNLLYDRKKIIYTSMNDIFKDAHIEFDHDRIQKLFSTYADSKDLSVSELIDVRKDYLLIIGRKIGEQIMPILMRDFPRVFASIILDYYLGP